jgi:hypothetical protein
VLPTRIGGKRNVRGPAWHRTGRQYDRVADGFIASAAPIEHPRQHRHIQICIVVDADFAFAVEEPVQPPRVLRDRPAPRHREREHQRVEPRVVESFADVLAGRQQNAFLIARNRDQSFRNSRASKNQRMANAFRQKVRQAIEVIAIRAARGLERRRTDDHRVLERSRDRLCLRAYTMADRTTLHGDDGVMTVFPRDGRGQPGDESRLRPSCHLFEAGCRQVMTFIDDHVSVSAYTIVDNSLASEALNERDVEHPARAIASAADLSNRVLRQLEK